MSAGGDHRHDTAGPSSPAVSFPGFEPRVALRVSRIARARGLAQAIAECREDARLDGIREGAAEIVQLLGDDVVAFVPEQ